MNILFYGLHNGFEKVDKALDRKIEKLYQYFNSEIENKLNLYDKALTNVTNKMQQAIQDNDLESLIKEVNENDKITVYTGATVDKTDGSPGIFKIFANIL